MDFGFSEDQQLLQQRQQLFVQLKLLGVGHQQSLHHHQPTP